MPPEYEKSIFEFILDYKSPQWKDFLDILGIKSEINYWNRPYQFYFLG